MAFELSKKTVGGIVHGIIPAFLMALSVGQIYAFTNFSSEIASLIGASQQAVQFSFSLGIFFLGMGAAFFGKIVEKNVKLSTVIGSALFLIGLWLSSVSIQFFKSLYMLWISYGLLLGLGTGIVYISPVKTMMLWFEKKKAVAAAVPIISFGLGSTFSTLMYAKIAHLGVPKCFAVFSLVYLVLMAVGALLLKKPVPEQSALSEISPTAGPVVPDNLTSFSYLTLLKDRFFVCSWIFMFLNISAGLCLIPLAKDMMRDVTIGYSASLITTVIALSGVFNGFGRFVFAFVSDVLRRRINVIGIILLCSLIAMAGVAVWPCLIGIALLIINACYGAGFSVIPGILSDHYGMDNISKIHGTVLSAWGVAGLFGNQFALLISSKLGFGNIGVVIALIAMYGLNMVDFSMLKRKSAL